MLRTCARAGLGLTRCAVRAAVSSKADSSTTHFGFQDVPVGEKKAKVAEVFTSVADQYDLMNDLMSAGVHRLWKDTFVRALQPVPGLHVLDVAGGTGDIAFRIRDFSRRSGARGETGQAEVTVCDINPAMLGVGRQRALARYGEAGQTGLRWVEGDAEALPFADATFDAYTISFGIRNCTDIARVLAEAHRVLKPGGRFACLEFSHVATPGLRQLYDAFSFRVIPALGERAVGDRASYQYLVESIRRFPDQAAFARMIAQAGFEAVNHRDFSFGVVAMHTGTRPHAQ